MAHLVEEARSNRSTCRTCKKPIEKGAPRFGYEGEGYDDGEPIYSWHHLACAARRWSVLVGKALQDFKGELPNREEIDALLASTAKAPAGGGYPFAERAASGRSKCVRCHETIEKGAVRVAVERELEFNGMKRLGAAYLHLPCASAELPGAGLLAQLKKNGKLTSKADLAELEKALK